MRKCYWWNRWWHRRLRQLDRKYMLTQIIEAANRYDGDRTQLLRHQRIRAAWENFINEPGQEHWHCECAAQDMGLVAT